MKLFLRHAIAITVAAITTISANSSDAQLIGVLNDDSQIVTFPATKTSTISFDAGTIADKLVVQVSSEKSGEAFSVTYNGDALTPIAGTASGRNQGLFYLDNPYTGGAANLTVDMSGVGTVNGIAFGVVSVTGSDSGVSLANSAAANSVSLNTTDAGSFVVAGFGAQGGGGAGSALSPLNPLYGGSDIGSAEGAAGYQNKVAVGANLYSFSGGNTPLGANAAAFAPANDGRVAITDLFNTGVDASGNVLGNDVNDPHYQITDFNNTGSLPDSTITSIPGAWIANDPASRWIGVDNSATNGAAAQGNYTYETTFTIGGDADLSTVLLSGRWATDNGALDILVNDESVGAGQLASGFGSFTNFIVDASDVAFVHGTNTLEFQLNNAPNSDNPTGLRVDDLVGWYQLQVVPEPASIAIWTLLGLALSAFGYYRARRNK